MFKIYDGFLKMKDEDATMYIILSYLCQEGETYITTSLLTYYMYGAEEYDQSKKDRTRKIFTSFIHNYIGATKLKDSVYLINKTNLNGQYYCYLNWKDVIKVLRSNAKNKFAIIKYMGTVALSFNKTKKELFGYMPREYFAKMLNKTITSISAYTNKLRDIGVLYVFQRAKHTNIYCFNYGLDSVKAYLDKKTEEVDYSDLDNLFT